MTGSAEAAAAVTTPTTPTAPMKVVLLAPASVVHTQRWVEALHAHGVAVVLATQHDAGAWQPPPGVRVVRLPHGGTPGYFRNVPALRRLLRAERPDLLHAHYASGYGTTAAFAGFRPWLLSVWGSDVHDFPYQGRLQGALLRRNLRCADAIASTSHAMARQVGRLIGGDVPVAITPFGIDATRFAPAPRAHAGFVVGTVKTLAPKYGVDVLVRAFAVLLRGLAPAERADARLVIVGDGPQRAELEALGAALGLGAQARFAGAAPHADVPAWLHGFDVYVAASRLDSESFGVAVLEASACALPVVVSDAGGLPEVVEAGVTGLVVARDDVAALAAALRRLHAAPALRAQLGSAGRERVLRHYEWGACVGRMLDVYRRCVPGASARAFGRGAARAYGDVRDASSDARNDVTNDVGSDAGPGATNGVRDGAGAVFGSAGAGADPIGLAGAGPTGPASVDPTGPAGVAASAVSGLASVIVPCRNERDHVEAFCASVWRQVLPAGWQLEVVIADGQSSDGTDAVLRRLAAAEPRLTLIANPRGIVSTGLNLALREARGEVIVRMDVHTEYAPDYIAECLVALAASGADNVGGPWRACAVPNGGPTQQAVAAAFQSRWVAGGALSRRLDHDGWVDTVYLGCWPRATFARFGGFDETLVRNQDDEHNLRLARGGGRVWQSSRIRSVYRPRRRLSQVLRQYLQYGYWKPFVMKTHGQPAQVRHLVPGAYVALQALLLAAAALGAPAAPALVLGAAYLVAVAALSVAVWRSARLALAAGLRVPGVIVAYHVGYGVGFLAGAWDAAWRGRGRARFAASSR